MIKTIVFYLMPAKDKLEHSYLWNLIFFGSLFLTWILNSFRPELLVSDWWAYWFTFGTAAAKEVVHDGIQKKGTPEFKDFFAGILIASFFMIKVHPQEIVEFFKNVYLWF